MAKINLNEYLERLEEPEDREVVANRAYQRQLFLHSFITEFIKNGTARLINFRYPVFIGKPENGRKLLRHAGLWGKHP